MPSTNYHLPNDLPTLAVCKPPDFPAYDFLSKNSPTETLVVTMIMTLHEHIKSNARFKKHRMDGCTLYQVKIYAFYPLLTLVELDAAMCFEKLPHAKHHYYDNFTFTYKQM